MSRITKDLAEDISSALVKKRREELKLVEDGLSESIIRLYEKKHIPKEVIDFDQKFPGFVIKNSHVYLQGNGFNNDYFSLKKKFIINPKVRQNLQPTSEEAKQLHIVVNSIQTEVSEINKLETSIYNALLSLRTFKAVRENFPEAAELLPAEHNASLLPSLNISSIREQLK